MATATKKELRAAYKERPQETAIIFVTCGETGDMFLTDAIDAPAAFNRMRFQLSSGLYPDKRLQALWDQRGEDAFEFGVLQRLDPSDADTDIAEELENAPRPLSGRAPGSHQAESRPRRPAPIGFLRFSGKRDFSASAPAVPASVSKGVLFCSKSPVMSASTSHPCVQVQRSPKKGQLTASPFSDSTPNLRGPHPRDAHKRQSHAKTERFVDRGATRPLLPQILAA